MTSKPARTLSLALLSFAVVMPTATAEAARSTLPTVSRVAPLSAKIGDTLTIRGTNFRAGLEKNTVVFKRDGGKAVFVKAGIATSTQIRVVVPASLAAEASHTAAGAVRPTRFRVRVLSARLGKSFTATALSPVISAAPAAAGHAPATAPIAVINSAGQTAAAAVSAAADCDADGTPNSTDTDDDNDFLPDTLETQLGTATCNADTDGDGMQDGWEYQSAIDLNNHAGCSVPYPTPCAPAMPYPSKMTYPNPLDGTDANTDYDGDWLTGAQEYTAWARHAGHNLTPAGMWYSEGLQASQNTAGSSTCVGMPVPAPLAGVAGYSLDTSGNGCLDDSERDEDGDYLTNAEEVATMMSAPTWWSGIYTEVGFRTVYKGTNWLDPDSDGDTVVDGLDDQDFDDFLNIEEMRRGRQSVDKDGVATGITTGLWVNPFNPCLPWTSSRTCPVGIPLNGPVWAPFVAPGQDPIKPRWPLWSGSAPPAHPMTTLPS